jgi:hypothetical protein
MLRPLRAHEASRFSGNWPVPSLHTYHCETTSRVYSLFPHLPHLQSGSMALSGLRQKEACESS